MLSGLTCAFAALCYAEFCAMIPVAGSAYTYSYATLGEFLAWLTGWAPHPNQQKPLKPGSAKARLADALKVPEQKL